MPAQLFLPGPTHVRPEILAAFAEPMIGHRGPEMRQLLADCLPGVREAFGTTGDVVVLSCASTAAMEATSRSVIRPGRRALHLANGSFSRMWWSLSTACGLEAACEELPWGEAWDQSSTAACLDRHTDLDAVFVCHSETSTGALSDIAGVARAVRAAHPEALVCVDVTSSACGVPLDVDALDLDVVVGGVQKAWALPPVLALMSLSPRAIERMDLVPDRGRANDPLTALRYQRDKAMTLTTPAIPVLRALRQQLADIRATGGFPARFARHRAMAAAVHDWAARRGIPVLAQEGHRSPTVTSLACQGRFAIPDLLAGYHDAGYVVASGYGRTRTTHWRIGHMGDHTEEEVSALLTVTDRLLEQLGSVI